MKVCAVCGDVLTRPGRAQAKYCLDCAAEKQREWGRKNKNNAASRAHMAVNRSVRKGDLPDLSEGLIACVDCGKVATCHDHRDYSKPLDVDPVCGSCNWLRGKAVGVPRTVPLSAYPFGDMG
jgi:hypothetical protein